MGKRTIYCGWCGKEHGEDSSILKAHQDKIANDPRSYGKPDKPRPPVREGS